MLEKTAGLSRTADIPTFLQVSHYNLHPTQTNRSKSPSPHAPKGEGSHRLLCNL